MFAGDEVVLYPLLVVRTQLLQEGGDKVDVLLLEGGALGPLVLRVLEPQCQGVVSSNGRMWYFA
jgi:hypothetical protein